MAVDEELLREVGSVLRHVAATMITPRFRRLAGDDVREKTSGELVTVADTEAELAITAALRGLLSGGTVVGEEAVAADPGLLEAAKGGAVWLVDPIDGTSGFVAGSPDHAVMVALLDEGVTEAAWVLQPAHDRLWVAARGQGVTVDGVPIRRVPAPSDPGKLRGIVKTRYVGGHQAELLRERSSAFAAVDQGPGAAGIEYPALVEGDVDFVLYWRVLPWDHAPGALLCTEAGACLSRLDGRRYEPWATATGLLVAADEATRTAVLATLDPDGALADLAERG